MSEMCIGVDLGGTNLRLAAFDGGGTTPLAHRKSRVGEPRDPDTLIARIVEEVTVLAPASGRVPVGVGIAAMLRDRRGTVANSPHLRWRDVDFGVRLAAALGPRFPVGVYNDVNAIAYGEYGLGAGAGAQNVLAVYVGTGIGGGLIVDGRLAEGASNCAGEIGHVKVRWDDRAMPCACGGRGCVEAYVGGSYVQTRIRAELAGGAPSRALALAGRVEDVNPGHVDQAAAEGDAWALELWAELSTLLAVVLAGAICLVNPDRLILGGGLLGRTPVLRAHVELALAVAAPAALMEPLSVVDAALGDDAGIIGAALLARRGVSLIEL